MKTFFIVGSISTDFIATPPSATTNIFHDTLEIPLGVKHVLNDLSAYIGGAGANVASALLLDENVDVEEFYKVNEEMKKNKKRPAVGESVLLGITKASLNVEGFLSAASFQETTRVLTEAAVSGKVDLLKDLKENVIMGRLVPAGTGLRKYRDLRFEVDEVQHQAGANVEEEAGQNELSA